MGRATDSMRPSAPQTCEDVGLGGAPVWQAFRLLLAASGNSRPPAQQMWGRPAGLNASSAARHSRTHATELVS